MIFVISPITSEDLECNFKKDWLEVRNEIHVTCEFKNVKFDGTEIYNVTVNRAKLMSVVGITSEYEYIGQDRIDEFVTKITFKSSTILKIPNLVFQKFYQLRVFDGSRVGLLNITTLSFNGAANLEIILLHDNHLTAINNHCFVHTKNLKILDLSSNRIAKIQPHAFTSLNNLEELSLSNNNIKTIDGEIFRPFALLRWVWLDRNHFSTIPATLFPKNHEKLLGIYLNNNEIVKISPLVFNNLPKLRFLMLSGNNCTDKNFTDHVIQDNASIILEMRACYKEYRKDKSLMKEDEKHNMTKRMKRLESAAIDCVNETRHIEKNIVEALNQIQIQLLKLTQAYDGEED